MRLRARGAQPITQIAARILTEIDDVGAATVDREIARASRTDISVTGRGPTEQVLRAEIRKIYLRSKTDDLVHFVLRRTLRVEVAAAGRSGELIRYCRIEGNYSIVWAAVADSGVCKHRRGRVQRHCPPVRTRRFDVRG